MHQFTKVQGRFNDTLSSSCSFFVAFLSRVRKETFLIKEKTSDGK